MKALKMIFGMLFVLLLLWVTTTVSAQDVLLQFGLKGFSATKDTHITEYSGNILMNMGKNVENECCEYNPANIDGKSYLIWFDVSSIPKGAILGKATLELYMTSTRNGTNKKTVAAHRLLKDWAEGAGVGIDGMAAKKDEVCGTWTGKGEDWSKAGADEPDKDYVATADDSIEIEGKINEWYIWDITKMCQYWVNNPNKNFGAILLEPRPHAATLGTKVFASKENTNKDIYPKLTIEVSALAVDFSGALATTWGRCKVIR